MRVAELGRLTPAQSAELVGDEPNPWGDAGVELAWRDKELHLGIENDRRRLIASAGLLVVGVEAGGERFEVVGLGGVIVNHVYRGMGLSLPLIEAALAKAATLGPRFIVLFCHEDRADLYRRFDFELVDGPVLVEHAGGHVEMPMLTMWRALTGGATWPSGPVTVLSSPF